MADEKGAASRVRPEIRRRVLSHPFSPTFRVDAWHLLVGSRDLIEKNEGAYVTVYV